MINSILGSVYLSFFVILFFGLLAIFFGAFLFWRAGRRELVDSNLLFDILVVGGIGAFIGGRLLDFLIGLLTHPFSLKRLLFFNAYGGFSFYGAMFGFTIATILFLKNKNSKVLPILDLLAGPVALGHSLYLLGLILAGLAKNRNMGFNYITGFYFLVYFLCFWTIKRLEHKKRYVGFFIAYYLLFTSVFEIILGFVNTSSLRIGNKIPIYSFIFIFVLFAGVWIWYREGNVRKNIQIKSIFALLLLGIFKIKRILTSIPEADEMAKAILLLPYSLAKLGFYFVKLAVREIVASVFDLIHALGFGN